MAFCPNINSVEVKNKFNEVVTMFNGKPLSDEEFKSKDLRAERTGDDLLAMNVAYFVWDKYQGENIPESREAIENSITENIYVKPGVNELFESNPELAEIGTQQLYSQYLEQNPNGSVEGFKNWIDNRNNQVQYQLPQDREQEEFIASEKTIRDLAAKLSDRIGIPVRFESDKSKQYKGKLEYDTAVINLAYATLDTPIHEVLGHPIIRAIKNKGLSSQINRLKDKLEELEKQPNKDNILGNLLFGFPNSDLLFDDSIQDGINFLKKEISRLENLNNTQLYQNLLKELEYGKGKEVLDRVKRDYRYKDDSFKFNIDEYTDYLYFSQDTGLQEDEYSDYIFDKYKNLEFVETTDINKISELKKQGYVEVDYIKDNKSELSDYSGYVYTETPNNYYVLFNKTNSEYTLEEQQEEAIVELLSLYTADRLDAVKDGKLISLLKRLLKEMKAFMRSLIGQKEVEIDKLPDNITLGDIADLLAYSNSKLILPGNEVIYTTPDNQTFKTYAEASKHISDLAKSVENVDLNVSLNRDDETIIIIDPNTNKQVINIYIDYYYNKLWYNVVYADGSKTAYHYADVPKNIEEIGQKLYENEVWQYDKVRNNINDFIDKNKKYEQSKEIIEEWKKVNNIKYDPEEVYSRGQEFVSIVGAYSDFDVNLMMQNLLQHIEDNKKAGGEFTISAFTKPVNRKIGHLEGGGGKIKFKIYPQSQDIKWAANTDVYSGSVWDASEKVSKDKKSELLGVSYTKYPSLRNVNAVQPNLANIIDNLAHHHNELGISLTGSNFRLEYDEDIPYSTKKIINSINSILDQKYGKLVKPEIKEYREKRRKAYAVIYDGIEQTRKDTIEEAKAFVKLHASKWNRSEDSYSIQDSYFLEGYEGIQPTQTNETLKESIDSVKNKISQGLRLTKKGDFWVVIDKSTRKVHIITENKQEAENYINKFAKTKQKEYTEQALINTKIAKLKEVAKKYPRSLIRSEVKPISSNSNLGFTEGELLFQKISKSPKEFVGKNQFQTTLQDLIDMLPKADITENQSENEAMYQLSDESVPEAMKQASEEQIKQVESLVKTWLKRMGIKFENVPTIIDPDGNVIDAIAKASIMENVIQVVEGKRDITTLSEEAFHFLVELLGENNPLVAKMMENITSYEVYQETLKEYAGTYEGNETKIKKEAIGKALARLFVQEQTGLDAELFETKTRTEQLKRWFNRFWERVKQLFGVVSTAEITDKLSPFREAINMITSEDQQEFITPSGTIKELTYYQADTQRKKAEFDDVTKAVNGMKVTYDPVTKTYYTNGKPIKYRVTDAVKKFYLRIFKNPDKEIGERQQLLADKGTYVHALLQSITEKRINNERIVPSKLIEDVKQELRSKSPDFLQYDNSFFDITDDQYNQLVKGVNYILKEIETKTKVINEKTGLTGSAKIMTELAVYDKENDVAGTIDLAVVYPNGAIGIYDFKGINFFMKDNKIVNKLPTYKLSAYDIQINGYKRLLSSMLREQGVEAHFAETRIVPINMQLKYDRNGTREDGFRMLQMGDKRSNDNPFIDQISVAEEYTISESINRTLKNFYNLKSKLRERLASDPRNSKLQIEYEKVNSHINDILIRKSFDFAYKELKSLFENIEARRMFTPDDPNYITKEDLLYYVDYLKLYQQFTSNVEAGISNLIQSDKDAFMKVAYYLEKINHQVSTLQLERASEESDNIDLTKPGKKLSLMGRLFKTLSQMDHPAFQKLAKMVQNNYSETHIRVNEDIKEIEKLHNNLSKWVKKKGKSLQWGFDQIVNRKTGKLVGKIAAQWYKDRNTAREKRNYAWFRDFAQVTMVNNKYFYTGEAKELFEKRRAEYIKYVNNAYYGEANKAKRNKMISEWDNAHNITVNREALFNSRNYFIKSNDKDQYLTEEWKNLQKPENKALKDYYDMYIAFNKKYAELTGKDIDHNFIANIHKDLMDGLGESGLSSIKDMIGFFLRSLEVQQSDVLVGEIDQDTGLPIQKIPYLYTSEMLVKLSKKEEKKVTEDTLKKLRLAAKKDGRNIDENSVEVQEAIKNAIWYAERQKGLKFKSYDLTRSLILFSQASHTYALQKQTESDVLNLLELIKSKHVKTFIKNEKGSLVKKEDGSVEPMSVEGMSEEDQKIFERMVNVYWYGQHMDPLTFKLGKKELSGSKLIKMLMNFVSLKAIGLKPILAAGQFLNIKGNLYMFANEGIFFNNKQVNDAQKAAFRRDPKYRAAVEFFEARANPITYRKALFKSSSKIVKTVNLENAFYLHRKGDEVVEDNVLVAMMMNYGITKDGKVDRLSRIKKMEGQPSKSLWELASIDKNGKFSVEGLSQDQFKEFRTRVIGVGRGIKGNMTEMDKSLIGTYTLGAMLMHFKTWMQELGRQRFGEAQYDSMTGEIFLPRFRTAFGDIFTQTDSILKELGGLFLELAFIKNKKLNENAARYYYEKFLSQNPHLEGQITFEDYVEIREAKIRGMVREIQFYLSFIAMALFAKGMIPDDEDKIRKQAAINGYRIINRTLLEFSFWFSPSSVEQLIRFPIATGSFVIDLAKMFSNGFEELYNLLLGIEDTRDRTPMFHYMGKHIPGINSILDFIGFYENANLQINT